jgi:mono/diheme cytochrome c family protein
MMPAARKGQRALWCAAAAALATAALIAAVETGRHKASAQGIPRGEKPAGVRSSGTTFNRDIAPIVFQNCAGCHHAGEVAPFPLVTYQDVKQHARQIQLVTGRRIMPPWKAADGFGEFHDARRLADDQIAAIRDWVEAGTPEGKRSDLPRPPKFTAGWMLGEPDTVLEPEEPYTLAAEGRDVYRCFVVPTNYSQDRYISAVEVRPGNRMVVHHMIAFIDTSGAARKLDAADPGPGYTTFGGVGFAPEGTIGGWAPGNLPRNLPAGVGILLPKGADVVLQVHYHKSGKIETDRTRVGLYFCKGPVDKRLRVSAAINPFLRIPPGDSAYTVRASRPVPADVTVLQVMPHMHLLGREMTVTATLPDGSLKPMVKVPDWDFNWQTTYTFREPLKLPRGSRIDLVARYDNSDQNPRNPSSPPKVVTWGEQTTNEMCIAFFFYTVDAEHLTQGVSASAFPGGTRAGPRAQGALRAPRQLLGRVGGSGKN